MDWITRTLVLNRIPEQTISVSASEAVGLLATTPQATVCIVGMSQSQSLAHGQPCPTAEELLSDSFPILLPLSAWFDPSLPNASPQAVSIDSAVNRVDANPTCRRSIPSCYAPIAMQSFIF